MCPPQRFSPVPLLQATVQIHLFFASQYVSNFSFGQLIAQLHFILQQTGDALARPRWNIFLFQKILRKAWNLKLNQKLTFYFGEINVLS